MQPHVQMQRIRDMINKCRFKDEAAAAAGNAALTRVVRRPTSRSSMCMSFTHCTADVISCVTSLHAAAFEWLPRRQLLWLTCKMSHRSYAQAFGIQCICILDLTLGHKTQPCSESSLAGCWNLVAGKGRHRTKFLFSAGMIRDMTKCVRCAWALMLAPQPRKLPSFIHGAAGQPK